MDRRVAQQLQTNILLGPYRGPEKGFLAGLWFYDKGPEPAWMGLSKPEHATEVLASRMLALLALQQEFPLIHPVVVPTAPCPASAFFLPDGLWYDLRPVNFPETVRAEVERVAAALRTDHSEYVQDVTAALTGRRPARFGAIPADWGMIDPTNEFSWAPPPPPVEVLPAALDKFGTPEFFYQLVSIDYRRERYLEALPDNELTDRAADAMLNVYDFSEAQKLDVNLDDQATVQALSRMGEVMEEVRLRRGEISADWYRELAKRWGLPKTPDKIRAALAGIRKHSSSLPEGGIADGVAKYGEVSHMEEALERGRFLISPASRYTEDPSLNRAQSAVELEFEYPVDLKRTRFELLSEDRKTNFGPIPMTSAKVTHRFSTNVYVFCSSRRLGPRLFNDFDADACLLIRDRHAFMSRLVAATTTLLPDWRVLAFDVNYLDPFSKDARAARPVFTKPIRYQYQHEHRVIWVPPTTKDALDPFFVEIGSLSDIAEVIRLDQRSGDGGSAAA